MKKIVAICFLMLALGFGTATTAKAANLFCPVDQDFTDMVNCLLNDTRDNCATLYPDCDIDSWQITGSSPISQMINLCCVPGDTDAEWDACFQSESRKIRRAKALPLKFRKYVRSVIVSYIANPELECTEH